MMHHTVRDVMTDEVVVVATGTPVKNVAKVLGRRRISGVPVVDADEHVVGVVTVNDLLRTMTGGSHPESASGPTARELMTAPAVTIGPDASIVEAAAALERSGVGRLPVVDAAGSLVGVVSRGDLVKVFTRPDELIRAEVVEDVVEQVLSLPPEALTVEVVDGIVTLRGELANRGQAAQAVALVRRVDGVARVVDELTYRTGSRRS